jgi:membrane-bound serine protease (ClpP class)
LIEARQWGVRQAVVAVILGLFLAAPLTALAAPGDTVVRLDLDGVVDPFTASYLESGIEAAEADGASAILLTIDTPGGTDNSMRKIIRAILDSPVPVICFVAPEGARAASAGTFILMSCPVAAMAPGTNVGAAHPVGVRGAVEIEKVTNDAAAYLRSLAEERGRNGDWAERAVRDSDSISAQQALDMEVVDLIQPNATALLDEVDGRTVKVAGGRESTLSTAGAEVADREPGTAARLLQPLFSPNLAFLFFYLGLALIVVELLHPGLSVPGLLGTLLLGLAFAAFGMLPIQLLGIGLLAASVGFFLLEFQYPGVGFPAAAGVVTLVLGGLLLFDRSVPDAQVSISMIAPVAVGSGLFFGFVVKAALAARRLPPAVKSQNVIGAIGQAVTDLAPSGVVQVVSETWTATSPVPVAKGAKVRVTAVEGLRLSVEPAEGVGAEAAAPSTQAEEPTRKEG